jgi:hypothetical protein
MDETTIFIIRCQYDGGLIVYYQSPNEWTITPSMATLFRDYDVAITHMIVCHQMHGDDGSLYDVAPYWGEVLALQKTSNNDLT